MRRLQRSTLARVQHVHDWLDQHGPVQCVNVYDVAHRIGIAGDEMIRVLSLVRSPEWIEVMGWTIPFVSKGIGIKTYSVERTVGKTSLLREGNRIKSDEMETHLRRNLAGLQLEAKLATGTEKRKAQILATTSKAALDLIEML